MGFGEDVRALYGWIKRNWRGALKEAVAKKYWPIWFSIIFVVTITVLVTVFEDQIVELVTPYQDYIKAHWWFAIIFIVGFMMCSIPPMMLHAPLSVVVGLLYGFWAGSGIMIAGSVAGEYLVFATVRHCFIRWAQRKEQNNLEYACVAELLKQGGLGINTLLRLSLFYGHATTALQAVAGTPSWVFLVADCSIIPREVVTIYLGTSFGQAGSSSKVVSVVLQCITILFSIVAAVFMGRRIKKIYPEVKARWVEEAGHALEEKAPSGGELSSESEGEALRARSRSKKQPGLPRPSKQFAPRPRASQPPPGQNPHSLPSASASDSECSCSECVSDNGSDAGETSNRWSGSESEQSLLSEEVEVERPAARRRATSREATLGGRYSYGTGEFH